VASGDAILNEGNGWVGSHGCEITRSSRKWNFGGKNGSGFWSGREEVSVCGGGMQKKVQIKSSRGQQIQDFNNRGKGEKREQPKQGEKNHSIEGRGGTGVKKKTLVKQKKKKGEGGRRESGGGLKGWGRHTIEGLHQEKKGSKNGKKVINKGVKFWWAFCHGKK